ncbi:MAG: hypothetical protein ACP5JG_05125 [Anaerolineae bacterium]
MRCREDDIVDQIIYVVFYDYEVPGETYRRQAREEVSPDWFRGCEVGTTVSIRYLALFPGVVSIEGNTYRRNLLSITTCLGWPLLLTLGTLLWVVRRPPRTPRARRAAAVLLNGGCATTVVTLVGWLVELAIVEAVGARQGIAGLGIGLMAGFLVASLTWRPWDRQSR